MSTYRWLKLVHVLAAITAVGTNLTYFVWLVGVRRSNEHSAYVRGVPHVDYAELAELALDVNRLTAPNRLVAMAGPPFL